MKRGPALEGKPTKAELIKNAFSSLSDEDLQDMDEVWIAAEKAIKRKILTKDKPAIYKGRREELKKRGFATKTKTTYRSKSFDKEEQIVMKAIREVGGARRLSFVLNDLIKLMGA